MFDKPEQLEILHRFYAENDNYKVVPGHGDPDTVMVFFSSKGVFNENDFSDFEEKILKNDRYEWENLAKAPEIDRAAGSCIFVRDVRMEDYLNGISGTDCTVEKVAERLRQLTAGKKRRIFCGSSMGGFAAALLGTMLQVEAIFAFSGVADLHTFNRFLSDTGTSEKDLTHHIELLNEPDKSSYDDALLRLLPSYTGRLYWFFPNGSAYDVSQYELVKDFPAVRAFSVNRREHGSTILVDSILRVLSYPDKRTDALFEKYRGKRIDPVRFLLDTHGVIPGTVTLLRRIIRKKLHK